MTLKNDLSSVFSEQAEHRLSRVQIRNLLQSHILVASRDLEATRAVDFIREARTATENLSKASSMSRLDLALALRDVAKEAAPDVGQAVESLAQNLAPVAPAVKSRRAAPRLGL